MVQIQETAHVVDEVGTQLSCTSLSFEEGEVEVDEASQSPMQLLEGRLDVTADVDVACVRDII